MEWSPISEKDVAEALRATLNWKAPGREQIPYSWLKQFTATHKYIAAIFNKLLEADQIPEWLTTGITLLIPKTKNTELPENYRPVTCFPTTQKLLTPIMSRRMQQYIDVENLIEKEQKGCHSGKKNVQTSR
jgi:hypothetical protein